MLRSQARARAPPPPRAGAGRRAFARGAQVEVHWLAGTRDRSRANGRPDSPTGPPSTAASGWASAPSVGRELRPSRAAGDGGVLVSPQSLLASRAARIPTQAPRPRPVQALLRARAHRRLPHGRGCSGPAHAPGPARLSSGGRGRGGAAGTLLSTALRPPPPPRAVTSPPSRAIGPGRAAAANGRLAPGAALQIFTPRRPPADSWAAAPRPRFSSFVTTRLEQLPEEGRGHRVKVLAFTRQHSPRASRAVRRCVNRLLPSAARGSTE
ncbi:unnamed protein product [Nyctereutes procyonoides]|uniref:(raccoon dog) hypothetical protein n=1 Tax=Nyctereutes procyonoides TaxID=34880 RepID=A0A811YLC3_NYCPR|nr:unnamed protein product [Nyctereutes procyonoides]